MVARVPATFGTPLAARAGAAGATWAARGFLPRRQGAFPALAFCWDLIELKCWGSMSIPNVSLMYAAPSAGVSFPAWIAAFTASVLLIEPVAPSAPSALVSASAAFLRAAEPGPSHAMTDDGRRGTGTIASPKS